MYYHCHECGRITALAEFAKFATLSRCPGRACGSLRGEVISAEVARELLRVRTHPNDPPRIPDPSGATPTI